ncbi:hypothetical protein PARU111607_08475 [Palleronia rufa]|nr:hypothetical protein [Palleronia rufa]
MASRTAPRGGPQEGDAVGQVQLAGERLKAAAQFAVADDVVAPVERGLGSARAGQGLEGDADALLLDQPPDREESDGRRERAVTERDGLGAHAAVMDAGAFGRGAGGHQNLAEGAVEGRQ